MQVCRSVAGIISSHQIVTPGTKGQWGSAENFIARVKGRAKGRKEVYYEASCTRPTAIERQTPCSFMPRYDNRTAAYPT